MVWNVYTHDFNSKEIQTFNIFNHRRFVEDVQQSLKNATNKEELSRELKSHLMYYYWAKCEWEVIITSWPPHINMDELDRINEQRKSEFAKYNREPYCLYVNPDVRKKIDVYSQVMLNFDVFVDYVWRHKE